MHTVGLTLSFEAKIEAQTLFQLKDINHTNVNPFLGVFQQGPDFHVLWNVCQKGSLQDVLQNDDIECDWTFRLSFVNDIAKVRRIIYRRILVMCKSRLRQFSFRKHPKTP